MWSTEKSLHCNLKVILITNVNTAFSSYKTGANSCITAFTYIFIYISCTCISKHLRRLSTAEPPAAQWFPPHTVVVLRFYLSNLTTRCLSFCVSVPVLLFAQVCSSALLSSCLNLQSVDPKVPPHGSTCAKRSCSARFTPPLH